MNSSDNIYQINILNNTSIYLYKYVLLIFYVIANIGNILSFVIFTKKSWSKNVCVFYFKFCLIIDSCYINSTVLAIIFMNGFQINLHNYNIILCKLYFYTYFFFAPFLPTILILASIDRLLISSQNVDTRLYSSKRLAYFSTTLGTLFWALFSVHGLIKVDIQEIYPSNFICSYNSSKFYYSFVLYFYGITNFILCVLMIILCSITFKNVRHIRAIPREQRHQPRSMTKKDFRLLRCLFVQDVLYITVSMFLSAQFINQFIGKDRIRSTLEQAFLNFLQKLANCLFQIPYFSNFFVFMIISKAFRCEFKRLVYKIIGKDLVSVREEENRKDNSGKDNAALNVVSTIVLHS